MSDELKLRPYSTWGKAGRSVALILLACTSLVFGFAMLLSDADLSQVLSANQFPPRARESLLFWLLAANGLGAIAGLGALRRFGVDRVYWFLRGVSPLIPLSAVPILVVGKFWFQHQLDFVLSLLLVALVFEATIQAFLSTMGTRLLALSRPAWLDRVATSKRGPLVAACLCSLAYVLLSGRITVINHRRFLQAATTWQSSTI